LAKRYRPANRGTFLPKRLPSEVVDVARLRDAETRTFAAERDLRFLRTLLAEAELDRDFWRAMRCTT